MALLQPEQVQVGTIFLSPRLGPMIITSVGPHTFCTESDEPPLWTAKRFDMERRTITSHSEVGYEKSDLDTMIFIDHAPEFADAYEEYSDLCKELEDVAHELRSDADRLEEMAYELEAGLVSVEMAREALASVNTYLKGGNTND